MHPTSTISAPCATICLTILTTVCNASRTHAGKRCWSERPPRVLLPQAAAMETGTPPLQICEQQTRLVGHHHASSSFTHLQRFSHAGHREAPSSSPARTMATPLPATTMHHQRRREAAAVPPRSPEQPPRRSTVPSRGREKSVRVKP